MFAAKQTVAVIDYGTGNLRSVLKAFETLDATPTLATRPDEAKQADALVFPGQGCFPDCMHNLRKTGWADFLQEWLQADRPYFGICLGLQVLFEHSEEGDAEGLGVLKGYVQRFQLPNNLKIPHMGWNEVIFNSENRSPLKQDLKNGDQFYFVHSYRVIPADESITLTKTNYGGDFVSSISFGNCHATQFHPEKSQAKGLQIYRNFLEQ